MTTSLAQAHLSVLRTALQQPCPPWTSGIIDVRREDLTLFYGDKRLAKLNFTDATEEQLQDLAGACQPATFGLGTEDVLDEGYRKAGKLDCSDFAAALDIGSLEILDAVVPDLWEGAAIRAELYKLNVYGPGSFFKSHKDTPRSGNMVGSLVLVLPTQHQGGQLSLSHGPHSSAFDSATLLAGKHSSIAYVALFSDVTHAVEPVVSGFRVTLTYNLQPSEAEVVCQRALTALLADAAFLPRGGLLGFGLEHEYPVPRTVSDPNTLSQVRRVLKGADARIERAASRAGLKTELKLAYTTKGDEYYDSGKGVRIALDSVVDLRDIDSAGSGEIDEVIRRAGQAVVRTTAGGKQAWTKLYEEEQLVSVCWVTEPEEEKNRAESAYIAMGNEPVLEYAYGRAVLLVEIPRVEGRV
ncbi:Fe2OG dioxygenase domain-containing protein [Mycena indigotica]|uniref:Fe2OG dioxygenase domain-containing protein n=1 Tax=Mycena indigotica TaxID=2126181 RepID=A0A8H6WL92_9AGAR|nr:Fe2OG dioxygenase domain-containing protein [Mycena indigotica]KAF7316569.1 Fe2OG dioxygenase domain-containing protein [Mycena indigotica]